MAFDKQGVPPVDISPARCEALADDLQLIRWPADQGSKLREDAAHTLRALRAALDATERERDEARMRFAQAASDWIKADTGRMILRVSLANAERERDEARSQLSDVLAENDALRFVRNNAPALNSNAYASGLRDGEARTREAIAAEVDCGCPCRDAVLNKLREKGERAAQFECKAGRGRDCCAIQAVAIRTGSGGGSER